MKIVSRESLVSVNSDSQLSSEQWSEDIAEFVMESVIRGHHVYKTIWQPRVGEQLALEREDCNSCDRHAVSVMKEGAIVGHIPQEVSRTYWYFIRRGGTISCEVTGSMGLINV